MHIPWNIIIIASLIFLARITDVTIGTIRIVYISRGKKLIPSVLGFIEAMLWIIVISQVIQNLTSVVYYFAYAGGFAMGNFFGILLIEKFSENILLIRIITAERVKELIKALKNCQVGITEIQGQGVDQNVSVIFTIIGKGCEKKVIKTIQDINPNAFYTIENINAVSKGYFPQKNRILASNYFSLLNKRRKYK